MPGYSTLAAVDLGSNSFRLQVARVEGRQLYPLDNLREMVRLAAGLTPDKRLDEDSQARALACLKRFGERLRKAQPVLLTRECLPVIFPRSGKTVWARPSPLRWKIPA